MARVPDEDIRRLKREVSLERLVLSAGVKLRQYGANLVGRCPFHDDKGPSLVVSPRKNLWHCLGACRQGGSVIDWVMKARGLSFREAVDVLRDETGGLPGNGNGRPAPAPKEPEAEDQEVLAQVVSYYHETLKATPEALGYLEGRGLCSSEMIGRFRLGFSNRTLWRSLPSKESHAGQRIKERLGKLGLLRESGHELFAASIVIPILGEGGEVLGLYGRKIAAPSEMRKGTPCHLYLPGPHRGIFNLDALQASKVVILCEALLDALTFWCAGFRAVTASYGVSGFTADHLAAFKHYGTETVLIAYDRDEAGDRAAASLSEKLLAEGITCYRIQFPKGMDANEYATKVKPAEKSLGILIRNAVWLGKGQAPARDLGAELQALPEPVLIEASTPPDAAPAAASDTLPLAASAAKEETALRATEGKPDEIVLSFGDRRYRVRGLSKNLSFDSLKVNLLASSEEGFHVDTLELYSARQRTSFLKQAATELKVEEDVVKGDLRSLLLKLEELQEEQIRKALEPKTKEVRLSGEEEAEALGLLKDPRLLDRILADFEASGLVGEEENKLLGYIAAVSRKLEEPLAVVVQSSSSAGKTSLMEAILAFVPEEERVKYSAMTGQSLFYMSERDLRHKVLAIVEEQGAERASYALKLLQSEGELMIASTGKDPTTGRLVTQEYRVEGPVMIFLTTTAVEIDEELLNRCLVLTVDEEREQTRAIHRLQRERETLEGLLLHQERKSLLKLHQNAQRLLRPLLVANPFAPQLTFLDDRTRMRRDHTKYLTLIRAIALLHQYQRPVKTVIHRGEVISYIEATRDDVALANRLAHQVLGRSLDELAPQTRRLLLALERMATEACKAQAIERKDLRLSRRQVREHTGWGNTQLKVHLHRLEEMEYIVVHRGRGQGFLYELVYDGQGQDGRPFVPGLIDVETLSDGERSALLAERSGGGRPPVGAWSGAGRSEPTALSASIDAAKPASAAKESGKAHLEPIAPLPRRTAPALPAR